MKRFSVLWMLVFAFLLGACNQMQSTSSGAKQAATPSPSTATDSAVTPPSGGVSGTDGVLARLNGAPITDAEVTALVKDRLKKVETQIYDIKKEGLDQLLEEKLIAMEAARRNLSSDELIKVEVESKVETPSETEITTFYSLFKKRFKDQPLEQVKGQLVEQIKQNKRQTAYSKFVGDLRKSAKVEVLMERPRVTVATDDDPSQGKADAPITLIEFSDFQCPFCKRTRPTISKILETYPGKIYYVFRDYPLSFHKQAKKASEAAQCAGDQKKYWEYNTKLWDNQGSLEPEKIKEYAKALGLNEGKFNSCLDSGKFADEVEKDLRDGINAGVSGTPAYFVNGIMISGAQPFEKFQSVIDEELEMKSAKK